MATRIRQLAALHPDGERMLVTVIAPPHEHWPLPWYLRTMPHVGYWTEPGEALALEAPVIVASTDHTEVLDSALGNRYVSEFFGLRPEVLLALYIEHGLWDRPGRVAMDATPECGGTEPASRHCEAAPCGIVADGERAMTPPELALVVPCYNEAERLDPEAFLQFVATHPGVQLVLVDDGSQDATGEILERMRAAAPASVTTLRHSRNRGKAEAVRAGILAGLAQRATLVGFSTPTWRRRSGRSTISWPCCATGGRSSSCSARA